MKKESKIKRAIGVISTRTSSAFCQSALLLLPYQSIHQYL